MARTAFKRSATAAATSERPKICLALFLFRRPECLLFDILEDSRDLGPPDAADELYAPLDTIIGALLGPFSATSGGPLGCSKVDNMHDSLSHSLNTSSI